MQQEPLKIFEWFSRVESVFETILGIFIKPVAPNDILKIHCKEGESKEF